MTLIKESNGNEIKVCDGCGRQDSGPNSPLNIEQYAVLDPNIGSTVQHDYCTGCALNRGSSAREILQFGWTASAAPVVDEQKASKSDND